MEEIRRGGSPIPHRVEGELEELIKRLQLLASEVKQRKSGFKLI